MSLNNEVRLIGNVVKDPEVFDSEKGKFGKVRIAANTRLEKEKTLFLLMSSFSDMPSRILNTMILKRETRFLPMVDFQLRNMLTRMK